MIPSLLISVVTICLVTPAIAQDACWSSPCAAGACVNSGSDYQCQCPPVSTSPVHGKNCDMSLFANCGQNFYTSSGTISSPNYPNNYNNRAACAYFVKIPGAQQITFTFVSFNTEINRDVLEGRTGAVADNPFTMSWEGNLTTLGMTPEPFTVMSDSYVFYFTTDRNIPLDGFQITYGSDGDDCAMAPCQNGGTCMDLTNDYQCTCVSGFTGKDCEIDINECGSSPCRNGGVCFDGINRFTCTCLSGWVGDLCEINLNGCSSSPCRFGATCNDMINQYTCTCQPGYTGLNCEIGTPGSKNQVTSFIDESKRLDPDIPLVCLPGNHDIGDVPTADDINSYKVTFGDDFYAFWVGGVRFIVLNSQLFADSSKCTEVKTEQDEWLDRQLEDAQSSGCKHIVVFQHIPWFLKTPEEDNDYFNTDVSKRMPMLQKLQEAGVRIIFCGHYHRRAGGFYKDMEQVVTSAWGLPLGEDKSGAYVVKVTEDSISHQFYTVDELPLDS